MNGLTRIVCPTCGTVYQVQLESKGIVDDTCQLSCHVCSTIWAPLAIQTQPSEPRAHVVEPIVTVTPPPEPVVQTAPPPPPAWTPPPQPQRPAYTPTTMTAPPPVAAQNGSTRRIGTTIGLIILGTCIAMACIVAVLRHKDGKPLTWITQTKKTENPKGSEALTIRDVRFDVQKTGQRQTILVVGMIDNPTKQAFTLHPLQVSVWGPTDQPGVSPTAPKEGDQCLLIAWQHPFDVLHIDPGQSRPFQTVGSLPADIKISRVDVTLP